MRIYYALLFYLLFAACSSEGSTIENRLPIRSDSTHNANAQGSEFVEFARSSKPQRLLVSTALTQVRARPDIQAPIIAQYTKGDTLHFAHRLSNATTRLRLEGVEYDEPWLLVHLPTQAEEFGWVYGGALRWIDATEEELQRLTTERRIRNVFGEWWIEHLRAYRLLLQAPQISAAQVHQLWQRSHYIADSLQLRINELTTQQLRLSDSLPDFFWLNPLVDNSLLLHWMADERRYYLWRDLRLWQRLAQRSADDSADDDFMRLQLMAFAQDSFEFRTPDYIIWVDSLPVHSLGDGLTTRLLDSIEVYAERSPLFRAEYQALRLRIVGDLVNGAAHFWNSRAQCRSELDTLLSRPYVFALQRAERITLQTLSADFAKAQGRVFVFGIGGGGEGSNLD